MAKQKIQIGSIKVDKAKTRRQDAESIIGEELTDILEKSMGAPVKQRSGALIEMSKKKSPLAAPKLLTRRASASELPFGGAVTMDEATAWLKEGQKQENSKSVVVFDLFMKVCRNILQGDEPSKRELLVKAVDEMLAIMPKGVVVLSVHGTPEQIEKALWTAPSGVGDVIADKMGIPRKQEKVIPSLKETINRSIK